MSLMGIFATRRLTLLFAVSLLWGLSGCSSGQPGTQVSTSTVKQVQPGVTTATWLKATFGEPTVVHKTTQHVETWEWQYSTTQDRGGAWFVIFYGPNAGKRDGQAYATLHDGVLERLSMADGKADFGGEWRRRESIAGGPSSRTVQPQ